MKLNATFKKSQEDPNYSPFLKSFGKTIVSATIQQTEIQEGKYIVNQLEAMRHEMQIMRLEQRKDLDNRRKSSMFDNERDVIIRSIIGSYNDKYKNSDILNNDEVLSNIKKILSLNNIDISNNELRDYLLHSNNNYKKS